jgi:biotin carboxyl carrier protein
MNFDLDTVREVAQILRDSELAEICIETTDEDAPPARLLLRRAANAPHASYPAPTAQSVTEAAAAALAESTLQEEAAAAAEAARVLQIVSPAVGIFRPAPKGGVREGDVVKARQVVGIVESLRVPNEVTCPIDGTVRAVRALDGQGVEFGQLLFEIEETP